MDTTEMAVLMLKGAVSELEGDEKARADDAMKKTRELVEGFDTDEQLVGFVVVAMEQMQKLEAM